MSEGPTQEHQQPVVEETDDPRGFPTASGTHVGRVRTENQDACTDVVHPRKPMRLLLTADGMGGHRGGSVAARLAVETGGETFTEADSPSGELARKILDDANHRIHTASRERAEVAGMGSTGVALLLGPRGRAWVAHVGDSRLYRLRAGRLDRITDDHSLVAELVRAGRISEEEARSHPRRNQLQRALGVQVPVQISLRELEVQPGDRYLICSDGMWGAIDEAEIASVLGERDPESAVRELIERSVYEDGSDNSTVQVVAVPGEAPAGSASEGPRTSLLTPRNLALSALALGLVLVLLLLAR